MFYLCATADCTFRVICKVNIFIYMDDEQFSPELTSLLSRLNKYNRYDYSQVLALRTPERAIFMEAAAKKDRLRREEFTEMIKGK